MREFGIDKKQFYRTLIIPFIKLCLAAFAILQGASGNTTLLPPVVMLIIGCLLLALALFDVVRYTRLLRMYPRMIISEKGVEDTSPAGKELGLVPWDDIEAVLIHSVRVNAKTQRDVIGILPKNATLLENAETMQRYLAYGFSVNTLMQPLEEILAAMGEVAGDAWELRDGFPITTYPLALDTSPIRRGLYRRASLAKSKPVYQPKEAIWPSLDDVAESE